MLEFCFRTQTWRPKRSTNTQKTIFTESVSSSKWFIWRLLLLSVDSRFIPLNLYSWFREWSGWGQSGCCTKPGGCCASHFCEGLCGVGYSQWGPPLSGSLITLALHKALCYLWLYILAHVYILWWIQFCWWSTDKYVVPDGCMSFLFSPLRST